MKHQRKASKSREKEDFLCRFSQLLWTRNTISNLRTKSKRCRRRRFPQKFMATDGGICCFLGRIRTRKTEARFKEWGIQRRRMRPVRHGIANPEKKEKDASTLHSVVSTLSMSSREAHDLLSICQRRCFAKQRPKEASSASNSKRDATGSKNCSTDYQRSKKRKVNTSDSTEKKKPKVLKIEIAETGTRCKRRNGKGWRCSETRVRGYSLCEHHLSRTQAQPSKNKKKKTTKKNVFDAESGFHALPAVDGVDNSEQEYAGEYDQKTASGMETEMQVKKHRRKKKSLKDINSVLDCHPHHSGDFAFELCE